MQGGGDAVGDGFELGVAVVHGNTEADALQHLNVVQTVAEGYGLMRRKSGLFHHPLAASPFVDGLGQYIDGGAVPAHQIEFREALFNLRA